MRRTHIKAECYSRLWVLILLYPVPMYPKYFSPPLLLCAKLFPFWYVPKSCTYVPLPRKLKMGGGEDPKLEILELGNWHFPASLYERYRKTRRHTWRRVLGISCIEIRIFVRSRRPFALEHQQLLPPQLGISYRVVLYRGIAKVVHVVPVLNQQVAQVKRTRLI